MRNSAATPASAGLSVEVIEVHRLGGVDFILRKVRARKELEDVQTTRRFPS